MIGAYMMLITHRREIQTNFRLTMISEEMTRVTRQIRELQNCKAKFENIFDSMLANRNQFALANLQFAQSIPNRAVHNLQRQLSNTSDPVQRQQLQRSLEAAQEEAGRTSKIALFAYQAQIQQSAIARSIFNKVQDAQNEAKLRQLHIKEDELGREKLMLEHEAQMFAAQLKSYKEKANKEAEESAPKFGLS